MNKTPYEIRLDILAMAQRMLEREHDSKMLLIRDSLTSGEQFPSKVRDSYIKQYAENSTFTVEELNKRATEMYAFVNNSSKTV